MEDLSQFILSKGHQFNLADLEFDGRFHNTKCELTSNNLWYIAEKDTEERVRLTFGCFKDQTKFHYSDKGVKLTKEERSKKKKEREIKWQNACRIAEAKLSEAEAGLSLTFEEPHYLKRKGLEAFAKDFKYLRDHTGSLMLCAPMYDATGKLWNVQFIQVGGSKSAISGARGQGVFLPIGDETTTRTYICEGLSTALSVHAATNERVLCAFGLTNIENVLQELKRAKLSRDFVVIVDNDHGKLNSKGLPFNAGVEVGEKLKHKFSGIKVITPQCVINGESDYNDIHLRLGLEAVKTDILTQVPEVPTPEPSETSDTLPPPTEQIRTGHDYNGIYVGDIQTFDTGFHATVYRGETPVKVPCYTDLRTYFDRIHGYKIFGESKICMRWTGSHYEPMGDVFIEEFAQKHFFPTAKNNVISEFKGLVLRTNVTHTSFFTDRAQRKINFKNGYLDIDKNEFLPHSKDIGFRYTLPYDYDALALCPEFDAFMKRVTLDDKELEEMILEYFGYALSGDKTWAQKMLILLGDGANGKSTLVNTMRLVFGEKNTSAISVRQFSDPNSLALMEGKLINLSEETPKKAFMESDVLKNLVTGGIISIKKLYKDRVEVRMNTKLMLLCNELPPTWDSSSGFYRRLLIAPFNATFTEDMPGFDPFIEEKLGKELTGICNRVLAAYLKLKERRRFFVAQVAKDALEQYKNESDQVLDWKLERITVHPLGNGHDKYWAPISTLYENFAEYCQKSGMRAMPKTTFGKQLRRIIPDYPLRYGFFGPKTDRARGVKGLTRMNGTEFATDAVHQNAEETGMKNNGGFQENLDLRC